MPLNALTRGLVYALIPLGYYLTGLLNYAQAGKSFFVGFMVLVTLFLWRSRVITQWVRTGLSVLISLWVAASITHMGSSAFLRSLFGVQQDDLLVVSAIFNTHSSESSEFFQQHAFFVAQHLAAGVLLFALYYWLCIRERSPQPSHLTNHLAGFRRWRAPLIMSVICLIIHTNPTTLRSNPIAYLPYWHAKWQSSVAELEKLQRTFASNLDHSELNALRYHGPRQKTVVLVIGESDTRANWSLYGYPRQTNPLLSKRRDELALFKQVLSADAGTVISIQKMLTLATLDQPKLFRTSPTLVTMAQRVGFKVFWLSNQNRITGGDVTLFASLSDHADFINRGDSRSEGSFDQALLQPLKTALADEAPLKLIVLHLAGAHPAYHFRYPETFDVFSGKEDRVSTQLAEQGRAFFAIKQRNEYDNALRYIDYNLNQFIEAVSIEAGSGISSLLYLPDHGEDVAHHTNFAGHNAAAEEMWQVPMLLWSTSETLMQRARSRTDVPYQADNINHVLLHLLAIDGPYYDSTRNLLADGFTPLPLSERYLKAISKPSQLTQ